MNTSVEDNSTIGIAAVNLGFGFTKISLDGAEDTFESIVSPHQRAISSLSDISNLLNIVHADGESFEVGMKAAAASWHEPYRLIYNRWGRHRHYRLLSQAVLNRMAFTGKKRWRIITGLAADHYQDEAYRTDVANVWCGMHSTAFGVIEVVRAAVVPDTLAGFTTLYSSKELRRQMLSHDGYVVDFGTMTTNFLPFKLGVPQSEGFHSIDVGVFQVMDVATRSVRRRALPSLRSVDLESAYLNIRPLSMITIGPTGCVESHHLDVLGDVEKAAGEVWPKIEVSLRANMKNPSGILLFGIGGGVNIFGELLRKSFGDSICQFSSPSDIQMENVRGLYLIAKSRAKALGGTP